MKIISALLIIAAFSSCSSIRKYDEIKKKENESLRVAVYATHDSIKAGRFDLADMYTDEVVRIIPPPENKIKINPIIIKK